MKGASIKGLGLSTLAWLLLAAAAPAVAGTVHKCVSPQGELSYVSKRIKGAQCSVVSTYTASRTPAARVPDWVPPPATGSVTASNPVAGSPASITASPPSTIVSAPPAAAAPTPARTSTPRVVQGQVYSYIQDGVRHYTSRPPKGGSATALRTIKYSFVETCYACAATPGVNFGTLRLNTTAYQSEVQAAAREFGVEEAVIRAIMHAESAFKPNALSRVGAQGLMQLMPATARRFGVSNSFDPEQNIRGGVQYLAWLLKRFNGNLTLAAAGYNAGEGAVDRHKGVPPYSETRRYVERVAVLAERYRGHLASAN